MPKAILGKKMGMTQIFTDDGRMIPVTVLEVGPCFVSQIKTEANDGYEALQLAYGSVKPGNVIKPAKGHFDKAGTPVMKHIRELRLENTSEYKIGQEVKADIFAEGEKVDVVGTSKGKGFAGTIKRWGDHRGPMSHGSKNHRRPGTTGPKGPARVFKGKHSPGRMGGERVKVRNLEVVRVDVERNFILVKGAVPGPKKGLIEVRNSTHAGN